MAFKMNGSPMHYGTSAHKSALKKASPMTKTWKEAYASRDMDQYGGMSEGDYIAEAKRQKTEHAKTGKWDVPAAKPAQGGQPAKPAPKVDVEKKGGRVTATETSARGEKDSATVDKKGRLRKTVDQENLSTYDAKTQTGSSGLGMKETTQRYKKSGDAKRRSKTTYSKGTDSKRDDKVTKTKSARKPGGRSVSKTKDRATGAKSKMAVKGAKGNRATQVHKTKDAAGTVTKTKHYTTGKKTGTSKTKERKKGQLFGRKVDVDYS